MAMFGVMTKCNTTAGTELKVCTLQMQISPCLERENSSENVDIGAYNTFDLWCYTSPKLVECEHHLMFT